MPRSVDRVHVVAKTHLDLGFTALASEVVHRYLYDFFPRALRVADELRSRGGTERLVWTTGSWIVHQALEAGRPEQREAVAEAIVAGDLAWHALALTTHTELMDAALVRSSLGISRALDARFGRTTTAAKMTDVPGHTRGLVPLLAEAGVTFLHLGVNPAWPVPDVPPAFRWRSPDGAEIAVAYQAGGYGGEVVIPGCGDALAFLHAGDNLGPPSADEVVAAHEALRDRYPGAVVAGSTLGDFALALASSGAAASLPVVTAEIGDPWLFGAGSDPLKVAAYRRLLREGDRPTIDRRLLLVAEHTWGLDQKEALPDLTHWDRAGLATLRATPAGARFEASWAEQRAYLDDAVVEEGRDIAPWPLVEGHPPGSWSRLRVGETIAGGTWELALGPSGSVDHLVDLGHGRVLADADHQLGVVGYQSFEEADYERFYAGLEPRPDDEWWARLDNTKPGIDAAGAVSGTWRPDLLDAWHTTHPGGARHDVVVRSAFGAPAAERLGAPAEIWLRWSWSDEPAPDPSDSADLGLTVWWVDKPASRLPEAVWCSFVPLVAQPEHWTLDKLGQAVSPLDVVRRGGRGLHGVGRGMAYEGPDGSLEILTPDAPLVAPGSPRLLDADPPVPDLAGGFHVLLEDNCWGTNFPMWSEGPARFRFTVRTGASAPTKVS